MYKYLLTIFLALGLGLTAMAQVPKLDTIRNKKDSLTLKKDSASSKRFVPRVRKEKIYHPDSTHDPHKAVIRSLMIPGWGQIYNHQWWKVPFIYAGLGALTYGLIWNEQQYKPLLVVAIYYEHVTNVTPNMPQYQLYTLYATNGVQATQIYSVLATYERDRDLCIFGFLGAWGIQAIDAYIDAKFKHSYTMDTDFTFKAAPTLINQQSIYASNFSGAVIPGLKFTLTIK